MSGRRLSWSRDVRDSLDWLPTHPEYEHAHEVALLALLVATLDVVTMVLLAENRSIGDDERPAWRPVDPTGPAAENVLRQIDRLRRALTAYRSAAAPAPPDSTTDASPVGDDDIPF